jgi:hypothetical protein
MPQLNWTSDLELAGSQHATFRSHDHGPTDDIGVPRNGSEIRFNKLTDGGKRYLDIAVHVAGHTVHYVLDRDQIEALRGFLSGPDVSDR